jgi:hypothetical protein
LCRSAPSFQSYLSTPIILLLSPQASDIFSSVSPCSSLLSSIAFSFALLSLTIKFDLI